MKDWQKRVIEEKNELTKKIIKLGSFFGAEEYEKIDDNQKGLLLAQHYFMDEYSQILSKRIALFYREDSK